MGMAGESDTGESPSRSSSSSPLETFIEPDSLPVFIAERDGLEYRIMPRFNRGKLRWAVRVTEGGRIRYEDITGLSEDAAAEFGVDSAFREQLNDLRQFVNRTFPQLPVKGNRKLVEYPLADIAAVADEW